MARRPMGRSDTSFVKMPKLRDMELVKLVSVSESPYIGLYDTRVLVQGLNFNLTGYLQLYYLT